MIQGTIKRPYGAIGKPARKTLPGSRAATTAPSRPVKPSDPDAEIIELSRRIVDLRRQMSAIADQFAHATVRCQHMADAGKSYEAIRRYRDESGYEAGVTDQNRLADRADKLVEKLWPIRATTNEGRQAKVRALFSHVLPQKWRESDEDADWNILLTRQLLFEFAGIDGAEILVA